MLYELALLLWTNNNKHVCLLYSERGFVLQKISKGIHSILLSNFTIFFYIWHHHCRCSYINWQMIIQIQYIWKNADCISLEGTERRNVIEFMHANSRRWDLISLIMKDMFIIAIYTVFIPEYAHKLQAINNFASQWRTKKILLFT